ncbi:MAG: TIGR03986 family CRISPR-associated RAMP protein [Polyangiaceae bacterium]|nr:TIGR03986 family CRISPR-associated RAMP protein [Polyangiaceae bacterium]
MTKWPQHQSPADSRQRAKAPYNFVPLPEALFLPKLEAKPFEGHSWLDQSRFHGWLELDITTETATYTRAAYPPDQENIDVKKSAPRQEHYHHGDPSQPVLPGSSLRGMIRSLVEILSYSRITRRGPDEKATRLLDKKLVHRFVADPQTPAGKQYQKRFLRERQSKQFDYPGPNVLAGYIERSGQVVYIRPAEQHHGVTFVRVDFSLVRAAGIFAKDNQVVEDPVFVQPASAALHETRPVSLYYAKTNTISKQPGQGLVRGRLVCSGPMGTKKMHTVVYAPDNKQQPIPIPREVWAAFEEDRELQRGIPYRKVTVGQPCFYLYEGGRIAFLGPNLFFRIPYPRSPADFVPDEIVRREGLDLAEAMFGSVNPGDRKDGADAGAHRGRVFFDDAVFTSAPDGKPYWDDHVGRRTPAILSTPKPTSYQHYLVQSDVSGDVRTQKAKLKTYYSSRNETVIRGHKLYWHRGEPPQNEYGLDKREPGENDTQRTVIRPVRRGVTFKGKVRFENLTKLELGALLTALDLPEGLRHRFGMGKPLGMGSIHVRPTLHLVNPTQRYRSLSETGLLGAKESAAQAEEAKNLFQKEIEDHYNGTVESPKVRGFWSIPRLDALCTLLNWEERPDARETRYMTIEPNEYKHRPVLPTPAAVMGRPDPFVQSFIPKLPENAHTGSVTSPHGVRADRAPAAEPAPKPAEAPRRAVGGRIAFFRQGQVGILVDGETSSRKVKLDLTVFPLTEWKKIDGNQFRQGRPVTIELSGSTMIRVVPKDR